MMERRTFLVMISGGLLAAPARNRRPTSQLMVSARH
jgi:hypothetical protein